ncbi:hypothetical protein [Chondrinema litorale]|uniref:hypothetical protein n=1 Tax=Chondrinema litorale TaxID=2994555 RepID=UPI002543EE30|nr:hypothetical protein [Chondrinema litorale]UZR98953.1 hypothetical protein OQ292_34450 [Chondrinema litorale]
MKQEKRIKEIMNSLEGIQKVKAPYEGFSKIQNRLVYQSKKQAKYSWLKVAAVIALIICSNVLVVSNYFILENTSTIKTGNYLHIINDFNLYNHEK